MLYEKILFDDSDKNAYLEVFSPDKVGDFKRNALLVIPGGGYSGVCADREGEPIALAFIPLGFCSFVLHYTVKEKPFPSHLVQASKAIKYIKDNSEKYNIDKDKVFAVGFSAGGHLAATLGCMWNKKEIYDEISMPYGYNKPKGVMLIYPVISAKFHKISFDNLWYGEELTEEKKMQSSCENAVSGESCPAFILHTSNDSVVDVRNSLIYADALKQNGIEFEMHIYPDGPHGVALGNEITKCGNEKWCNKAIEKWISHANEWAKGIDKY
jgi:acetyl esterase/lipase